MIKTIFTAPHLMAPGEEFVLDTSIQGSRDVAVSEQYFCDVCKAQVTDHDDIHQADVTLEWYPLNSMRRHVRLLVCATCRPTLTVARIQELADEFSANMAERAEGVISGTLSVVIDKALQDAIEQEGDN